MNYIKPPYCRQGNKLPILDKIIPLIPPHHTYCELFAGSAVLFFNIHKAKKNVLNDLDDDVYNRLKLLQKAPLNKDLYRKDLNRLTAITQFYHHHKDTIPDDILFEKIRACNGFRGVPVKTGDDIYKDYNPATILNNLDYYKSMLHKVIITHKDYEKIVDGYDSPTTFFFIDPPYENTTSSFYRHGNQFDFHRLCKVLAGMKGKFLMTINDSKNIREVFQQFKIKPIDVKTSWSQVNKKSDLPRKELIITNF